MNTLNPEQFIEAVALANAILATREELEETPDVAGREAYQKLMNSFTKRLSEIIQPSLIKKVGG